ncbi:response regulator [Algoriphagus sp. CAU 1675]|uniref:response regulator n=1 Tax=Algoriphagus sp. CAU 1675 TaxID=3032597 RepID=UPI0023DBFB9F|nr:response regulator [Algoriphagus sp. CAU 1675]MDF2157053.1 response regulator [Algoriphagus sp. CAU 1675]
MEEFLISEVMFVEDDLIVKKVGSILFRTIGYTKTISLYDNGSHAIQEIQRRIEEKQFENLELPILLLLDINMPVMNSWDFLTEYASLDQSVKKRFRIAIITSSINPEDEVKAYSFPDVLDYIQKPLSPEYLKDFLIRHKFFIQPSVNEQ